MPAVFHERAQPDHAQVQRSDGGGEQKNFKHFPVQRQLDGAVPIRNFHLDKGGKRSASGPEVAQHRRDYGVARGERWMLHVRPLQPAVPQRGGL